MLERAVRSGRSRCSSGYWIFWKANVTGQSRDVYIATP